MLHLPIRNHVELCHYVICIYLPSFKEKGIVEYNFSTVNYKIIYGELNELQNRKIILFS